MVDTKQPQALAIIGASLGISTTFFILRIWARFMDLKNGGVWDSYVKWSDALLSCAYVLAAAQSYVVIRYTLYTWQGYHVYDVPKMSTDLLITGQKYNLANQMLYNPILSFVKGSVIVFLLRLVGTKRSVRISLWAVFVFNFALSIVVGITDLCQCTPYNYVFDYPRMDAEAQKAAGANSLGQVDGVTITGGYCINQLDFFLAVAALTVVTDLLVVAIPTWIVWDLQMARRKKIVASIILGVGLVVSGVSVARLVVYSWRFSPKNHDRSYGFGYTISSVEVNLAIATGCVPAFSALVRRYAPGLLGASLGYNSRPTPSGYVQHNGEGPSNQYALGTMDKSISDNKWEGERSKVQAWASDESILPGPEQIRKDVNVDVVFGEAVSIDERQVHGKQSF
ncbi:hypothetical protein BP6252_05714 [Coleophoma cylindrospora]|uniref:Rhodopsin domain-containing protein n=1 Tax=Coleophoma cylindrospora TaxID=1849047 RepID=A0A3D8RV30_9HELO|nr:hypothetical protein BP6252_05714 [Coleophoma cylindrospora]